MDPTWAHQKLSAADSFTLKKAARIAPCPRYSNKTPSVHAHRHDVLPEQREK